MSRIVPSITTPERGSCSVYKRLTSIRKFLVTSTVRRDLRFDGQNQALPVIKKQSPAAGGALSFRWGEEYRLPVGGTMGLRLPLGIRPEYLVCELFLLVGHCAVQVLESRDELLHILCMLLGDLLIGLHVLHSVHRLKVVDTLKPGLVHVASIIAHDLRKLIPLRALSRGNAELRVQLFDPLFDPFFGSLARHRVPCQWRGWRSSWLSPSGTADAGACED